MRTTSVIRAVGVAFVAATAACLPAAASQAAAPTSTPAQSVSTATTAAGTATTAAGTSTTAAGTATTAAGTATSQHPSRRLCSAPRAGMLACNAIARTDVTGHIGLVRAASSALAAPSGYGPADLQDAYRVGSGGSGATVAIVDAQDDPNAESDLATYRSQYGLPACTTANGCFRKIDQSGGTSYPAADSGWAGEISLDLDMVSATCPSCHILLVEATSASIANLGTAVNQAVAQGARYVSNSYGGGESTADPTYDSRYYNHPGVAVTASSGDGGYGVEYPAASPYVTAVGGTSLSAAGNSRGWTESAWNGAGSGCSADSGKPSFQTDGGCGNRTVADVAAVADPNTGVAVYDTYQSGGWNVYGGTSAASPIIASVYALAGTPSSGSHPNAFPYAHTGSLNDVTSGSNGSCGGSYLCTSGSGYDGPTGLGTPNGTGAFTG